MKSSQSIAELAKALAVAQGKFEKVIKGRKVDFTTRSGQKIKYNYAELVDVLDASRKPLSENGLAVSQLVRQEGDNNILETVLMHSSGEWIQSDMVLEKPAEKGPQAEGSELTYKRRYSLSALLGIASEEDDDGEAAMPRDDHKQQPKPMSPETVKKAMAEHLATTNPEHFCTEHQTPYFKRGNMKSYAHPIEGTKAWCNENIDEAVAQLFPSGSAQEPAGGTSEAQAAPTATDPATLADLMPWAWKHYGLASSKVCQMAHVKNPADIKDVPAIAAGIKASCTPVMAGAK